MPNDEEHQNDAGERSDHFFTDGRAIKRGESGHEEIRLAFLFSRSITIMRSRNTDFPVCASSGVLLRCEYRYGSGQNVRWAHRPGGYIPLLDLLEGASSCHYQRAVSYATMELPRRRSFGQT